MAKVLATEILASVFTSPRTVSKSRLLASSGLTWQRVRHLHSRRARRRNSPAESCFLEWCKEETDKLKSDGRYNPRQEAISSEVKLPYIMFADYPKRLLNFTSYDYLGLSTDPDVIMAYNRGLVEQGSTGTVRHIEGVRDWTLQLEDLIADFHGKEACFSYASVSEAMSALFYSVYGDNGIVLADEYNNIYHRGQVQVRKYKHMDIEDLKQKLHENKDCPKKVIVTDGVFSQTGEVAPMSDIMQLAEETDSMVILNDSHGIGTVGHSLRGTEAHFELAGHHDNLLITCDLGYGLGQIIGGYMVGSAKTLDEHVGKMTSLPIYTVDLSPASSSATAAIFDKLPRLAQKAEGIRQRSLLLSESLADVGLEVKGGDHPIISISIGKAKTSRTFAQHLRDFGHVISVITDPQLLIGNTHIRFMVTSAHTDRHIAKLVEDIQKTLDLMGLGDVAQLES